MLTKIRDTAPKTILLLAAVLFSIIPLLSMLSAALAPQGTVPVGISVPDRSAMAQLRRRLERREHHHAGEVEL